MAEIIWESDVLWPDDWPETLIHARFMNVTGDGPDVGRDPDISPARSGEVVFSPSVRNVRYTGEDGPYLASLHSFRAVVDAEGYLCTLDTFGHPGERGVVLPSTDAPVIEPRGEEGHAFTWRVDFDIPGVTISRDYITVPVGGPFHLVDLISPERQHGVAHLIDRVSAKTAIEAAETAVAARNLVLPARAETLAARDEAVEAAKHLRVDQVSTGIYEIGVTA